MKKVRKKGLSGATAVVTPLIFYCPLEHSANRQQLYIMDMVVVSLVVYFGFYDLLGVYKIAYSGKIVKSIYKLKIKKCYKL